MVRRGARIVVAISGASGISLALRLLRHAAANEAVERVHVVVSNSALRVAASEIDPPASTPAAVVERAVGDQQEKFEIHPNADIAASIASGSYMTDGMVIIPCSSGTLGAVANGISRNLIQRAADLTLKERRRLILALRETPLSLIHAENIMRVTAAGAIVMPPIPSFYAGETWDAYLDHFALRVLDLLGVDIDREDLRWKGKETRTED